MKIDKVIFKNVNLCPTKKICASTMVTDTTTSHSIVFTLHFIMKLRVVEIKELKWLKNKFKVKFESSFSSI